MIANNRAPYTRKDLGLPAEKLLAVTLGHANPNKRILEVIEAVAKTPDLRKRLIYAIVGPAEGSYGEALRNAVANYRLEETVRLVGYASDEVLSSYLTHADICINLRYPAMEGASASVIEEMLYGKPVIVTDSGFFRELPSEAVRKIEPEMEINGVVEALRGITGNPQLRQQMGSKAKRFAEEQADARTYAAGFLEFANEIMDGVPILKFTDRIAVQLTAMGVASDMPIVGTVAAQAYELFCANGREIKPLPD